MASAGDQSTSPVPETDGGSAGEFVLKKLFAEFVAVSERKLQYACNQPLVNGEAMVTTDCISGSLCRTTRWPKAS